MNTETLKIPAVIELIREVDKLRSETATQTEMIDGARRAASKLMIEKERLRDALTEIVHHAQKYGGAPLAATKMYDRARVALRDDCLPAEKPKQKPLYGELCAPSQSNEADCGGVFDGFQVTSDADLGL